MVFIAKSLPDLTHLNALNGLQLISKFSGNHDMQINLRNPYIEVGRDFTDQQTKGPHFKVIRLPKKTEKAN